MFPDFQFAAGTIPGRDHALVGKNNQDAVCRLERHGCAALVVSDGCGSVADSEIGAWLGTRWAADALLTQFAAKPQTLDNEELAAELFERVRIELLTRLKSLGATLPTETTRQFLFTLVGALLTPTRTTLFSLGDGVLALNGEVLQLGPFANNQPPYLAYGLQHDAARAPKFTVHRLIDTRDVQTLLLGTDGLAQWRALEARTLPGRNDTVGPLRQFWEDARYFANADAIRRKLALINRTHMNADWDARTLHREGGLLRDDTTLIVARRFTASVPAKEAVQ